MQGSLANVSSLVALNVSGMAAQPYALKLETLRQTLRHDFTQRRRLSEMPATKHPHGVLGADGCVRGSVKGEAAKHSDFWARCDSTSNVVFNGTLWIFLAKVHPDTRPPPCICIPGVTVQSQGVISEPRRDHGPCTAEAAPYLRGISGFYHRMRPGDTAVFVHFHATVGAAPWHAPRSDQYVDVLRHLYLTPAGRAYRETVPVGGLYCFWNDRFTQMGLPDEGSNLRGALSLFLEGTSWEPMLSAMPDDSFDTQPQLHYPCCATFFVSAERILAHPKHDYDRIAQAIVRGCGNASHPFGKSKESDRFAATHRDSGGLTKSVNVAPGNVPAGRLLEGAWHLMFSDGKPTVPSPPWCTSKWTLPRPYGNVVQPPVSQSFRRAKPALEPPRPTQSPPTPARAAIPRANEHAKEAREWPKQGLSWVTHRVSSLLHSPGAAGTEDPEAEVASATAAVAAAEEALKAAKLRAAAADAKARSAKAYKAPERAELSKG
jgi:hypothetical protein